MRFSWRHPCSSCKSSDVHEPVKLSFVKKGKKELINSVIKEILPHMAAVKDRAKENLVQYVVEPVETDCPIRCPPPERGILHDGQIFKERLNSIAVKTRREFRFLTKKEVQGVLLRRRSQLLNDRLIFPSASAPEPSISKLLEQN